MKLKNNVINKPMEKSPTSTSSTETRVPTTHVSLRDSSGAKILFSILAFAVLVGVLIIPISSVISYASESSEVSIAESPELTSLASTSDGFDVTDRAFINYPTWRVFFDSSGSYTTPSNSGVYAYLTSVNSPKASTRSATSTYFADANYLTSRIFVFKNVNKPNTEQKRASISANFFDLPTIVGEHSPNYYTTFTFSNPTTLIFNVSYVPYGDSPSSLGGGVKILTGYRVTSDDLTLTVEDIFQYLFDSTSEPFGSDNVITGISISVDVVDGFDNVSPTSSYIDVTVKESRTGDFNDYIKSIGYTLLDVETIQNESWQNGYSVGLNQGFNDGYDSGYDDGFVSGETRQFNPGWFVSGVDAFLGIRLFQYSVLGTTYDFTLGTIALIAIGGTALLWFLKIFVGG